MSETKNRELIFRETVDIMMKALLDYIVEVEKSNEKNRKDC